MFASHGSTALLSAVTLAKQPHTTNSKLFPYMYVHLANAVSYCDKEKAARCSQTVAESCNFPTVFRIHRTRDKHVWLKRCCGHSYNTDHECRYCGSSDLYL